MNDDLSDAALVVIGHGTTLNPGSAASVRRHAAELRRRKLFAEVHEAFWKQEPFLTGLLPNIKAPRVLLVPFFFSEGYFSETVIPRALGFETAGPGTAGRVRRAGDQTLIYCRPVGTHPRMTEVVLGCAQGVVDQFPFPRAPKPADITLFLAGHGTTRDENSRRAVEDQVARIAALGLYAGVQGVFLEEEPRIAACYALAQTRHLVVVPFFTSDGLHTQEDIPVLLGAPRQLVAERLERGQATWRNPTERHGKLVWYATSVGADPRMAEVIVERALER